MHGFKPVAFNLLHDWYVNNALNTIITIIQLFGHFRIFKIQKKLDPMISGFAAQFAAPMSSFPSLERLRLTFKADRKWQTPSRVLRSTVSCSMSGQFVQCAL
jgi:hypothetical protein